MTSAPALLSRLTPIRDATDSMTHHRISPVVVKPVCTPVPLAGYGCVAGHAGFAPPAIALPGWAARYPAAGGTTSPQQVLRPQFLRLRAKARAHLQTAIRSRILFASRGAATSQIQRSGERNWYPPKSATSWEGLPSHPGPLPGAYARRKRLIDSLAFGPGCNSHTPVRMIVSSRV